MDVSYQQINAILLKRFGVEIDFSSSSKDLRDLMEHYIDKREALVRDHGNNVVISSAEYVKSHLITEAVRIFLREIAPRRINKIRRKKS